MAFSPNPDARHPTRGFAGMTPDQRREIARKGGFAVPAEKRSFATNRALAQAAGRKGGIAAHAKEVSGGE